MNAGTKILNNITKLNSAMYKKNKTPGPSGVYPRTIRLAPYSKIKVIHQISSFKRKNHVVISTDAEKVLDKIHHPFML